MTATSDESAGLGAELRRLRDEISDELDLPCVVGDPGESPAEHYLRIDTVRVAAPPYRADLSVIRVNAEVLVQAYGPDHLTAADTLARCMLNLMARGSWDLVAGQPDSALWTALGQPPVPAFMISIPVTLPLARPLAPPVRHPVQIRATGLRYVYGRVLAADGTPLSGARIRMRPDGAHTITGHDGRWSLSLPNVLVHLDVVARGRRTTYDLGPYVEPTGESAPAEQVIDITMSDVGATPAPPLGPPATT